jgi:hypothetical protein
MGPAAHGTALPRKPPVAGADERFAAPGAEPDQGMLAVGDTAVRAVRQQLQVGGVVVVAVAVEVVDVFAYGERPVEQDLHHGAVDENPAAVEDDRAVGRALAGGRLNPRQQLAR